VNARHKTCILKLLFALSTFLFVFPTCLIASATTYAMLWGSGWTPKFKFSAYNSYLQFDSPIYFDKLGYDSVTGNTKVYFYNPYMDGLSLSGWWWIKVTNGNVTITDFFRTDTDWGLKFTWTGSGSGTVAFYSGMGEFGKPYYIKIDGTVYQEGSHWTWDGSEDAVVISADLSSHTVEVYWTALQTEESSGSTGASGASGIISSTTATITESAQQFVQTVIKPALFKIPNYAIGLVMLGFMILLVSVAYYYDAETLALILAFLTLGYVLNLVAVWVLIPMNMFPSDLAFLQSYLWNPPSLNISVVGLPQNQLQALQLIVMSILFALFASAIVLFSMKE